MTGGLYLRPRTPSAMLQYLLTCFASHRDTRKMLELPRSKGLHLRATCFCHSRVITVGYVCSVCLSVFCEVQHTCTTCGTDFGKVYPLAPAVAQAAACGEPATAGGSEGGQ
jgi:transcription initiation factor TFIIH subunit 3